MRGLQQLSLIDSHLSFLCVGVCVRVFTHTYTYYICIIKMSLILKIGDFYNVPEKNYIGEKMTYV